MPTQKESSGSAAEITRFRSQDHRRKLILTVIIWVVAATLLIVAVITACNFFFSIDMIVVDGTGHYSFTEITEACSIEKGQMLLTVSEKKISQTLTERFAFVRSVKVEKQYPSTVVITVEEEKPEFYFEMSGEYFLVTRSLKVLEQFALEEKLIDLYPDAMEVLLPEPSRVMVGEKVVFATPSKSRHTDEVLTMLAGSRLMSGITAIDLSDRFDITVVYEERITVHMGSATDFEDKLDLSLAMIKAHSDKATGVLYAENAEKGIAQITDPEDE